MNLNRRLFLTRTRAPRTKVFISYRRRFDHASARLLKRELAEAFGEDAVFRDVDDIAPGDAFPRVINEAIESCDVFLALISPGWVETAGSLQNPDDFVRREIAAALARRVHLIPVLIGGARMPNPSDLPDDIRALTSVHATELSDSRWQYDTRRLTEAIRARSGAREQAAEGLTFARRLAGAARSLFGTWRGRAAAAAVLLAASALAFLAVRYASSPDYATCLRRLDGRAFEAATTIEYGTVGNPLGGGDYEQALRAGPEGFPLLVKLTDEGRDVGAVFVRYYVNKGGEPFFKVQKVVAPPCVDVQRYENADRKGADKRTLQNWDHLSVRLGGRDYRLRLGDHGDGFRGSLLPPE